MLKEHSRDIRRGTVLLDGVIVAAAFAGLLTRPGLLVPELAGHPDFAGVAALGALLVLGWPFLLWRSGAYETQRQQPLIGTVLRLAVVDAVMALGLGAGAFMLDAPMTRMFPVALAGAVFTVQIAIRVPARLLLHSLRRSGRNTRNLLVIGAGPRAAEAYRTIECHPEWGLRVRGFIDDGESAFTPSVPVEQIYKSVDVPQILRERTIDEVLVACPRSMLGPLVSVVQECALIGIPVTLLTDLFGSELPPPRVGSFDSLKTLSFAPVHHGEVELAVKRTVDIAGATLGLAIAAPVVALSTVAIRLSSPGPIFFRQIRLGMNGRPFEMLKMRTMVPDAESQQEELAHLNEMDGPVFKIRNDPRITPVGRILRKWSIDELPQLWNVLRGEMSLVGPRPPTPEEVLQYVGEERRRLSMRPGLTCLWQVSGRNNVDFHEWMKLDLQYIDAWSLATDVRILFRTIPEVLRGTGAS